MFLRIIQHLLPTGRAWFTVVNKFLRKFFDGLAAPLGDDTKEYLDEIYFDLSPTFTRELDEWEFQFNLQNASLTTAERRARLNAAWKQIGKQDPRYIQDTLRGAGFDVYVHEWWVPGTEPALGVHAAATARNPTVVLFPTSNAVPSGIECGEPLAECGEPTAECGNIISTRGYPLVNRVTKSIFEYLVLCNEPFAECGEPDAICGDRTDYFDYDIVYTVPSDTTKWPYFLYIGGQTFPDLAGIPQERKREFETLCLRICPAQQWLGILCAYT